MENKAGDKASEGNRVYELGFSLISSIPEDKTPAEFGDLKALIEKLGGAFISEDAPKLRQLSYQMRKKINNVYQKFDTAYFGWVKFEMQPESLLKLKADLDLNKSILRYILINTVRENTLVGNRFVAKTDAPAKAPRAKVEKVKISEAEIDKSIEELVAE